MLRSALGTLLLLFSCLFAFSQSTGSVSGKVIDSLQRPLEGATILLVTSENGVPIKTALSDSTASDLGMS
ncbi:hypothetical protein HRH25_12365 [Flavisolibacter sp. BT320]|nr:hypothetical protein [Flavisolibacter longurius]